MRMTERDYNEFDLDRFPNMWLVRTWADCTIWSAGVEEILLVLVDSARKRVALFEYDTLTEREKDVQMVLNLKDGDGGDEAGLAACIPPFPPVRSGKNAKPIPTEENES